MYVVSVIIYIPNTVHITAVDIYHRLKTSCQNTQMSYLVSILENLLLGVTLADIAVYSGWVLLTRNCNGDRLACCDWLECFNVEDMCTPAPVAVSCSSPRGENVALALNKILNRFTHWSVFSALTRPRGRPRFFWDQNINAKNNHRHNYWRCY